MTVNARLGENLRRHRKRAGLSQEKAAIRASVHPHTIRKAEIGFSVPVLDTFIKLAGALSVTPGDLLDGITWRPGFVGDGPGRYRLDDGGEG